MSEPGGLATADGHDRYVPSCTKDILSAGHEGVYEWVVARLVRTGARFLDLGCGTGYGAVIVTAAGASFDGTDSSAIAIDYARATFAGPQARFFVADLMESLPEAIEPGSYDVVFSSEVLEHVIDPFSLIRTMARYVRDDGVCFVGTPNRLWTLDNMPGGALMARSHVMEFTPPALEALLRTAVDHVDLIFRTFPIGAMRSTLVSAGRPRLVRGAFAFVREVAPDGMARLRHMVGRRQPGPEWSPDDIQWLPAGDPGIDPAGAAGLAAVCRSPQR